LGLKQPVEKHFNSKIAINFKPTRIEKKNLQRQWKKSWQAFHTGFSHAERFCDYNKLLKFTGLKGILTGS